MMASDSCLVQIYIFYDPFLVNSQMFFTGITLFAKFSHKKTNNHLSFQFSSFSVHPSAKCNAFLSDPR